MCGVAAVLDLAPVPTEARTRVNVALAARMGDALAHRGPDGAGVWSEGPIALAHRRLAILDLSAAGAQPMTDADGALHITYNGEVYNYLELRRTLRAYGHRFTTGTDTEVILAAYRQWGVECLARFNGMFAFALWDARRRRLFCARDRFGIKSLYHTVADGRLLVASEAKALLATGLVPPRPNDAALHRFLLTGYHPAGRATFFAAVEQLPPGHVLLVEDGRTRLRRWWRLPAHTGSLAIADGEAVARFRDLFLDAVRLRLRSDVPVGTCLSGGLDSSAIVGAVAELRGRDAAQHTFSAVFDDAALSEDRYRRAVVRHTGARAHVVMPRWQDLTEVLPRLVWQQEAPFTSTSVVAQWQVMARARDEGVTVLLDGQGADEVLAGYPQYWDAYCADLARARAARTLLVESRRLARQRGEPHLRTLARAVLPREVRPRRVRRPPPLLHPDFAAAWPRLDRDAFGYPDRLTARLAEDLTTANLPALLHYEDRNSMSFAREARLPFLDYRLVEFAFTLAPRFKLRAGLSKWLLRAATRGLVPELVRRRTDKLGFVTPEAAWLAGPGRAWVRELISSPEFRARPYFDRAAFDALPLEPGTPALRDQTLWRCLSTELWLRAYERAAHGER